MTSLYQLKEATSSFNTLMSVAASELDFNHSRYWPWHIEIREEKTRPRKVGESEKRARREQTVDREKKS